MFGNVYVLSFQVDYGKAQKDKKEITVTTYFDCSTVTVKSLNPGECLEVIVIYYYFCLIRSGFDSH